jgi:hypothetical protein
MFLGMALVLLAPIFGHARYLDLTLPRKWKRLPVFLKGCSMYSRRVALYYVPCWIGAVAALMLLVAISQDVAPGPRSDQALAGMFVVVLGIVSTIYPAHVWRQRRWMRTGSPRIR